MANPRFIDNGDGTVTLPALGLMFTKATVTPECVTHTQAEAACAELRTAGHDDWRLPSTHELFALVDHSRFDPAIDTAFFPETQNDWYWTSTVCAWSSSRAWSVNFYSGVCDYDDRGCNGGLVRAVREALQAPPAAVPAGYVLVHVDRMLAACLPGGSSCDPQRVADAIREYVAAQAPPAANVYNEKRIAWELERTALGDGFYGNALRVAKDLPGIAAEDRAVLDRVATGMSRSTDHVALQAIASRIYFAPPAEQSECKATPCAVPAGYVLVPVEPTEAMLDAGHAAAWRRIPSCFDMTDAEIVYRAMLAAADKENGNG